jgi:hypothetical protein
MPTPGQYRSQSRYRRWLTPAIVIVIGGMLALWGMQRENARMAAIETQVLRLCRQSASGVDLTGAFNPGNRTVDAHIGEVLRRIVRTKEDADMLRVSVRPGDSSAAGSAQPQATHTAMLIVAGHEALGLRIACADPNQPITVLGYWVP